MSTCHSQSVQKAASTWNEPEISEVWFYLFLIFFCQVVSTMT